MPSEEDSWTCWIEGTPKPSRSFGLGKGGTTYDRNFYEKRNLLFKAREGIRIRGGVVIHPCPFPEKTPLEMILLFFHHKPKSLRLQGECWKITIPDLDNCAYLVANALKGTIFHDDRQIVSLHCEKRSSSYREGILIRIKALKQNF